MTLSSSPSDYVLVGLAHCFTKQDGNVVPVKVLEPVPSAYFEALVKGVPTSYKALYSVCLSELLHENEPTMEQLPAEAQEANFCENFAERAMAAARTYQNKTDIQAKLPHGQVFSEVNFSTEKKRVLNAVHKVTAADNVKQHEYTHMTL
ncbi:MAG: hypothetical protein ACFB14_09070 [Leptolyngbyaceae cyanobacterium]